MEKKQYEMPETEVLIINIETSILSGDGTGEGDGWGEGGLD